MFEIYPVGAGSMADQVGLGFGGDDIEGFRERLSLAGYVPAAAQQTPWGRTFVVRDPDGRRVEVKEAVLRPTPGMG